MEQIMVTIPKRPDEGPASQVIGNLTTSAINTEPLTTISREPSLTYLITKRLIDVALAFIGILVLLPVFVAIAICIKLDGGGKILHFREIIGKHGRRFYALKFRTMIPDADGFLKRYPELMRKYQQNMKLEHDPRITRVGRFLRKTSLDELPQLYNVLRGEMSLVGPRPTSLNLATYEPWHERRLDVRPGVTGLWQVRGRNAMTFDERVELDLEYIAHLSLANDLKLLGLTILVVVKGKGA